MKEGGGALSKFWAEISMKRQNVRLGKSLALGLWDIAKSFG